MPRARGSMTEAAARRCRGLDAVDSMARCSISVTPPSCRSSPRSRWSIGAGKPGASNVRVSVPVAIIVRTAAAAARPPPGDAPRSPHAQRSGADDLDPLDEPVRWTGLRRVRRRRQRRKRAPIPSPVDPPQGIGAATQPMRDPGVVVAASASALTPSCRESSARAPHPRCDRCEIGRDDEIHV